MGQSVQYKPPLQSEFLRLMIKSDLGYRVYLTSVNL
jgi:hypothetical protein